MKYKILLSLILFCIVIFGCNTEISSPYLKLIESVPPPMPQKNKIFYMNDKGEIFCIDPNGITIQICPIE